MPAPRPFKCLILLALWALAPVAWCAVDDSPAMPSRLQVADAFAARDLIALEEQVSDPWSGLRFFSVKDGDEVFWRAMGTELREAKLISANKDKVIYEIRRDGVPRIIEFIFHRERWRLDLNSFLGPFPSGPMPWERSVPDK